MLLIEPDKPLDVKKSAEESVMEKIIIKALNFFSSILFKINFIIMLMVTPRFLKAPINKEAHTFADRSFYHSSYKTY